MVGTVIPEGTDNILRIASNVMGLPCTELWYREPEWGSPLRAMPKLRRGEFQSVSFQVSVAHLGRKTSSSSASFLGAFVEKPFSPWPSEVTNRLTARKRYYGDTSYPIALLSHLCLMK